MKNIIYAEELAKDVARAEALLERHQKLQGEIDTRENSFRATAEAGQKLVESDYYTTEEMRKKPVTLS